MTARKVGRSELNALWLGIPAVLLLIIPFMTLVLVTPWSGFHLAYGDGQAVAVSLGMSAISLPLIILLGLPLAVWLARTRSVWRGAVEVAVLVPLLAPPLALGILLVSAYGAYGSLGEVLSAIGLELNNNAAAFVLAQIYGGLPYFVLSARSAFEQVPVETEEAGRTLGACAWQIFLRLTLPQAARGLAAALAITWVRVIGEFGIVLVFSYFPQGIPVKLFINLQNEGVDSVYTLLWVLLITTLPLPLWCVMWAGRRGAASH
ncbi:MULTISPECIES: ABC transporter permease subunit [unclassified Pseudomonas]|uniref:ABC transporter permease subunit n=1 Tax=unclassified Pseudomonas TaxID=196821 RepID=UPI001C60CAFD|nr:MULTISPECIES: ABC transporter permease subunit [unclassified Pseudomonas]